MKEEVITDKEEKLMASLLSIKLDKVDAKYKDVKLCRESLVDDSYNIRHTREALINLRNEVDTVIKFLNYLYN